MAKTVMATVLAFCVLLCSCAKTNNNNEFRLTDKPAEEYAVMCLREVEGAEKILCVINDGDEPYKAAVFFESPLILSAEAYGDNEHEKEINRGGCIEIYSTVAQAATQAEQTQGDNHKQIGNFIVRVSALLDKQEKNKLKNDITLAIMGDTVSVIAPTDTSAPSSALQITCTPTPIITTNDLQNSEETVWVTNGGTRYHKISDCSNMENAIDIDRAKAESKGYTPCKRCYD